MKKTANIEELRRRFGIKDLLLREQIIPYILHQTGTLVTPCRVGRWIASGDLLMLRLPGRPSYRATRKPYVNLLIKKYST